MATHQFGLIGVSLAHSYSKSYYEELWGREGRADCVYEHFEMRSLDGLRVWIVENHILGFNVTNPFKQAIMPLLDEADEVATEVGATNCVLVRDGKLVGYNTDAPAFGLTVGDVQGMALILGSGGAAHAVAYALRRLHVPYYFVSRSPDINQLKIDYQSAHDLVEDSGTVGMIVNATPIGTFGQREGSPWPWMDSLRHVRKVYDLVYNPSPTLFMKQADICGCQTKDGLEMLHRQADLNWKLFQMCIK